MMPIAGADDVAFEALGESCLLLRFGRRIDAALNARVHAAMASLRAAELPGVVELVPAYAAIAVLYAPEVWIGADQPLPERLIDAIRPCLADGRHATSSTAFVHEIAVCYGGEYGPDLDELAQHLGIDAPTLIERHVAAEYRVAMLGFAPGFPYLLGLDPTLHAPRRARPRTRVPAGSVAIGGAQTGIYPAALPGGWQLIGRTPRRLFETTRTPPALLAPGDRVRFRAIDAAEFATLADRTSS